MFLSNKCPYCDGAGDWIEEDYNGAEHWVRCYACEGKGYLSEDDEFWEPVEDPHWEDLKEDAEEQTIRLAEELFEYYPEEKR